MVTAVLNLGTWGFPQTLFDSETVHSEHLNTTAGVPLSIPLTVLWLNLSSKTFLPIISVHTTSKHYGLFWYATDLVRHLYITTNTKGFFWLFVMQRLVQIQHWWRSICGFNVTEVIILPLCVATDDEADRKEGERAGYDMQQRGRLESKCRQWRPRGHVSPIKSWQWASTHNGGTLKSGAAKWWFTLMLFLLWHVKVSAVGKVDCSLCGLGPEVAVLVSGERGVG